MSYERSRKYKRPFKIAYSNKATGSKKYECPFKLRGTTLKKAIGMILKEMCGYHNHDLEKTLVGHSYIWWLSAKEKSLVGEMTKSMVKPRNILVTLKDCNVHNVTIIRHIYNPGQAYRSSQKGPRT